MTIEYSIDGGVSYSAYPMAREVVNGAAVLVPASPGRYTNIRWRVDGWLQPGERVVAEFRAETLESGL